VKLLYLVDEYPFETNEHFPGLECDYLCRTFQEVLVVPTNYPGASRTVKYRLPSNASVSATALDELAEVSKSKGTLRTKCSAASLLSLGKEIPFWPKKFWKDVVSFWGQSVLIQSALVNNLKIENFDVVYSFWSGPAAFAISRLKKHYPKTLFVARAHGYDLFSEATGRTKLPFQHSTISGLDYLFPCSKAGQNYLHRKFPRHGSKISAAYLGIDDPVAQSPASSDGVLRVVSCAAVLPVKRMPYLVDVLSLARRPMEWTHFGDGPEMADVRKKTTHLPQNIRADLRGNVPNADVLAHYRQNPVDLLVNVSRSEGLPVSMMEAFAFGIPCLGTTVGGVPEIINSANGYLLSPTASAKDIATVIERHPSSSPHMRRNARQTYLEKFRATANFEAFGRALHQLRRQI